MILSGNGAEFSPCMTYRYALWRDLGTLNGQGIVTFNMLNPSTAGATLNDPTIRRCIGFAESWGYRFLRIGNIYALRSTDPRALKTHSAPIGPENKRWINELCADADLVVCAWGSWGSLANRGDDVRRQIESIGKIPHHLGLTNSGEPKHPLYLRGDAVPTEWRKAVMG